MKYKNTSEWGKDKAGKLTYASGGSVKGGKDVKPIPIPLTPDSSQWNPDSVLGRFATRSPRPKD